MSEDSRKQEAASETRVNDGRRDLQRAITEMTDRLPEPLHALGRLAFNYRWSWITRGAEIFRDIDPSNWRRSGCNPRFVVESVAPRRLQELARDQAYVERLRSLAECVDGEIARPLMSDPVPVDRPIAYFCSEFGAHCSLPIYGGGLGILAGDVVKAASDLGLPMVGVGLLYREGYFHQRLDMDGRQIEYWTATDFERTAVVRVTGSDLKPLRVSVKLRGRTVQIHVWRTDFGRVPLYLLDTDLEENHPIDRWITARLYIGDRRVRLAQYAILGIGGVRALEALGIRPSLVHLNEGHAALGSLERLRTLLAAGVSYDGAHRRVRQETVFTTHTPVAAGNEAYAVAEVEPLLGDFFGDFPIPRQALYDLGRAQLGNDSEPLGITALALRSSRAACGVSKRHGAVARDMWVSLWPGREAEDVPIGHVTNGVHAATWMSTPMQELLEDHFGADWLGRVGDASMWAELDKIPDEDLWRVRCELRRKLVEVVRERSIHDRQARGESPDYVEAAARVFDPNALTVGFARRVATYKRLYLLGRLPEQAAALLNDLDRPIQFVVAGKAHPSDEEAKRALSGLFRFRQAPNVPSRVVFLEDYDMHLAPRIVAGVDLWLNLPRPPMEASGTSGMKVAMNGGLNLSVLDGWWEEAYDGNNGWAIATPEGREEMQDEHDAHALVSLLENEVIPLFYDRDADEIPRRWLSRVRSSMRSIIPVFNARRMVGDYVERLYGSAGR